MSLPPPAGSGQREHALELERPRGWGRRRELDVLRMSALGASMTFDGTLHEPLRIPLGTLQLGLVDPGGADASGMVGRFPILKRLSATAVIPREQGIEGWLWTSLGGSALTVLGDPEDAPNAALLFTKPLGDAAVACFEPAAAELIAARSPLGAPAIYGLLFRVADTDKAETIFRAFGLLRPLTDREVPPTLRRSLPTDRPADPAVVQVPEDSRAATSVAPPGLS
ncbi:MAG TPA: hypothetical protein VHJ39_00635 [Solirubrobacteraceae bacterium]|jgi:hypothetical protein|nr:hypothetical protein [Solirubrobacteraceae bacterium]